MKVSIVELGEQRAESREQRAESRERRAESGERRAESRVLIKFVVIYMAVMTVAITANESVAVAAVKLDRSGQGRCGRGYSRPVRRPRP